MRGETDIPTRENPAYVYEIEIINPLPSDLEILDPIKVVAHNLQNPIDIQNDSSFYQHDGLPNFLLGVVDPQNMSNFLIGRQAEPPGPGKRYEHTPSSRLQTLVNSLRDAEILIYGSIPPSCVKKRYDVEYSGLDLHQLKEELQ